MRRADLRRPHVAGTQAVLPRSASSDQCRDLRPKALILRTVCMYWRTRRSLRLPKIFFEQAGDHVLGRRRFGKAGVYHGAPRLPVTVLARIHDPALLSRFLGGDAPPACKTMPRA